MHTVPLTAPSLRKRAFFCHGRRQQLRRQLPLILFNPCTISVKRSSEDVRRLHGCVGIDWPGPYSGF